MHFDKILKPTQAKVRFLQLFCHIVLFYFIFTLPLSQIVYGVVFAYICNVFGSACGAHRLWSHRAYESNSFFKLAMALLFTITTCGSIVGYVLLHERHHKFSDTEKDPHSPLHNGIIRTWFGFYSESSKRINVYLYKQLMKDRLLAFTHNYYFLIIFIFALGLCICGRSYLIAFYCLPVVFQFHINSCVTVLCHWPKRTKADLVLVPQYSNISPVFKIILFGEELHKNHHLRPAMGNYNFEKKILEFDVVGLFVRLMARSKHHVK